jgi:soluble lytic murein transglycosylase
MGFVMRVKIIIAGIILIIAAVLLFSINYHTSRYDSIIRQTSAQDGLDFYLIKAIIFEESWFRSKIKGPAGEIGLMQITKAAAADFAMHKGFYSLDSERLCDPRLNVEIGCWYLHKSLERYKKTPYPVLYALLRYNAGESRADNWLRIAMNNPPPANISMETYYLSVVDFPRTRAYVQRILRRSKTHNYWY